MSIPTLNLLRWEMGDYKLQITIYKQKVVMLKLSFAAQDVKKCPGPNVEQEAESNTFSLQRCILGAGSVKNVAGVCLFT